MSKAFVTDKAPEFEVECLYRGKVQKVKLSDFKGKYVVLFFWPLDFTFVCPTEIIEFSNLAAKFRFIFNLRENNCEVLGASVDSVFAHMQWC